MFRLTIDLPPAPTITVHPDREAARADLLRFFTETRQAYRVTEADWTHTSYDVIDQADTIAGCALIDELCACDHTHREHDDVGCTVATLERGQLTDCECRVYQPVSTDPALFELDSLLNAPGPT